MTHSINIKGLKFLFYIIIPVSLMGMMNPPDPYVQARDALIADYNGLQGNNNLLLANYNRELLNSFNSMRNGANDAAIWANNQPALAETDSRIARTIYDRIVVMFGYIAQHAQNAQARAAAVRANVQGVAALPIDQAILGDLNLASGVRRRAEESFNNAEGESNRAQNSAQEANARHANIQPIINRMNPPILGMHYTREHIANYRANHANILTEFNQANISAFEAKTHANNVHNQVNLLNTLIQNMIIIGNRRGIANFPQN
ncbi:hypothetical protein [Cardinium endosymbiont of Nabis limbatus]|uniref:hypothetical protein n=1 Tax=Cardinium endosymbiont of Nabis limbatus TaxID=3066217 RepID=UPI003AF3B11D